MTRRSALTISKTGFATTLCVNKVQWWRGRWCVSGCQVTALENADSASKRVELTRRKERGCRKYPPLSLSGAYTSSRRLYTLFVVAAATFPAISFAVCFVGLALPPIAPTKKKTSAGKKERRRRLTRALTALRMNARLARKQRGERVRRRSSGGPFVCGEQRSAVAPTLNEKTRRRSQGLRGSLQRAALFSGKVPI